MDSTMDRSKIHLWEGQTSLRGDDQLDAHCITGPQEDHVSDLSTISNRCLMKRS